MERCLKDASNNYVSILEDLDAENLVASYTAQKLEEKLKLHFKGRIVIHKGKYKRGGSLIYNSNITLEKALKLADLQKSKLDQCIKDVALSMKAIIKNATHANFPSTGITFDDSRWRSSNSTAINSILHPPCCWSIS